jgi:hypothetical protein
VQPFWKKSIALPQKLKIEPEDPAVNTTTMEISMEAPQKTKNRSAISSSNSTPRDASEGMQHRLLQRHLHTHVYCGTIHNSQVMETAKMPHY